MKSSRWLVALVLAGAFGLLSVFALSAFGQTQWFKGTFDQAQEQADKEGKLILTFFYSPM